MNDISKIVKVINMYGASQIKRLKYNYTLPAVMNAVVRIGKSRYSGFVIDEDNRFAYENAVKWLMGDPTMQAINCVTGEVTQGRLDAGLYIAGNTGTGKTWLLNILSTLSSVCGIEYFDGCEKAKLRWENYRCDEMCAYYALNGGYLKYTKSKIVCFHDLGSEPTESCYMGNKCNVLRRVLESRGDNYTAITHFSSNYPINHEIIKQHYGDRAYSRLLGMCNYLTMRGADRRIR